MVNYEYFKNKTNGNLLIFLSKYIAHIDLLPVQNGDIYERERIHNICCQKSIFQLNPLSKQLFSCS